MKPAFVNRVAVDATHALRLMRARKPVPHVFGFSVAPQANAIGFFGFQFAELDDALVFIAGEVQAAGPMAVFAFQRLLRVIAVAEGLSLLFVAGAALVGTQPLGAGNLDKLGEVPFALLVPGTVVRFLLSYKRRRKRPKQCQRHAQAKRPSRHGGTSCG
jgi:uncharacterized membrane protein (UPF0136 family)